MKSNENKIGNAIIEIFGWDLYDEKLAAAKSSPRYGTLLALAGIDGKQAWETLKNATEKLANNPKTKAVLK